MDLRIESVTVSADEKNHISDTRGTFVSWTAKNSAGWSSEEAQAVSVLLNIRVTKQALASQLAKGSISKEEFKARAKAFMDRYKIVAGAFLDVKLPGDEGTGVVSP